MTFFEVSASIWVITPRPLPQKEPPHRHLLKATKPTPVLVLVAVVSRCTGATILGRKDFFFIFFSPPINFGFFFAARRGVAFGLIPPLGGSGFGIATLTDFSY